MKAVLSCALWSLTSILGNSDFPVPFVGRPGRERNEGRKKQSPPQSLPGEAGRH